MLAVEVGLSDDLGRHRIFLEIDDLGRGVEQSKTVYILHPRVKQYIVSLVITVGVYLYEVVL